jgi:hypothetical protein
MFGFFILALVTDKAGSRRFLAPLDWVRHGASGEELGHAGGKTNLGPPNQLLETVLYAFKSLNVVCHIHPNDDHTSQKYESKGVP